jgi:pimeloyl-ACP methyl ester carboxylesterase
MITGSGAQDRDETLLGHKPFLVIADALTRRGIAVLRLDDRGVFGSTGDFGKAVTADFAVDAEAAARYLRGRSDIDPRRVGLVGHSEGGLIAPMVAAADPKIAFAVLLAPPGAPLGELLAAQRLAIAPSMGLDLKSAEAMNAAMIAALAAMQGSKDDAEAEARAMTALKTALPGVPDASITAQARTYSSNWMRQLLAYDPRPNLRRMRIPVLAVIGSKDQQVVAAQNLPALREALKGDAKATVLELPGLNHLLQTAPTGAPGEYADIEETVAPAALTLIADWVVKQTGAR